MKTMKLILACLLMLALTVSWYNAQANSNFPETAASPPSPALISPYNGATIYTSTPLFDWSDTPGQTSFRVVVYDNSHNIVRNHREDSSASRWLCNPELPVGKYYWKVNVGTSAGSGPYSYEYSFTIVDNTSAHIALPQNGSCTNTSPITLRVEIDSGKENV